jgi:hypothetical protein
MSAIMGILFSIPNRAARPFINKRAETIVTRFKTFERSVVSGLCYR